MSTARVFILRHLIPSAVAAFVILLAVMVQRSDGAPSERKVGEQVSYDLSTLPKSRPTWQRPAPMTWSSRFNVRWEARWTETGKYMV